MITLKTLPEATAQEVYNFVKTQLLAQNKQSSEGDTCHYRGPNGLRCGGGMLISDEEYREDMEFNTWDALVRKGLVPGAHAALIRSIQVVHDVKPVEEWKDALESVALAYNLEP